MFQKSEERDFAIGAGRKIGGAAFGWSGAMAVAVPVKHGFAETCACSDDGDVVLGMVHTAIEKKKIFGSELLQAARGGDEIVHQDDTFVRQFEARRERGGVENPRNMRGVKPTVDNSAGDAEARGGDGAVGNRGERGVL